YCNHNEIEPHQELHSQELLENIRKFRPFQTPLSSFIYFSMRSEQFLRNLSDFGQRLIATHSYQEMVQNLREFLTNLSVSLCFIFIYPKPVKNPGAAAYLLYQRDGSHEQDFSKDLKEVNIQDIINRSDSPVQCVYPLRTTEEYLGVLVYNCHDYAQPHMCSCAIFLANNLRRLYDLEQELERSKILEEQVQLRTRELIRANEELKEEARRREAVEAEVLRISEMERMRFSLDLHDDICQRLAGLSMYAKSRITLNPDFKEFKALIDETLQLTRQYAHDAFPIELENLGLEKALETLCRTVTKQTGCHCSLVWELEPAHSQFPKATAINLYRIIQEAMANSVRHGKATWTCVKFCMGVDNQIVLTIQDNGKGDPSLNSFGTPGYTGGVGLRSIQYRAHQLGATFSIQSNHQGGTKLELVFSFPSQL
ncbi:MAG: sensor histidine kinase, partial [Termitinemataceae bacterium]